MKISIYIGGILRSTGDDSTVDVLLQHVVTLIGTVCGELQIGVEAWDRPQDQRKPFKPSILQREVKLNIQSDLHIK